MKIKVGLNKQSIKNAINALKTAKKQLQGEMLKDFLTECCMWFINRANQHLDKSDIGSNIIADIKSHWSYVVTNNTAKIINDSEHAVYVEFGVGLMGEQIPHPEASKVGYQYNIPSDAKHNNYWVFGVDSEDDVDMHKGYQTKQGKNNLWIITKGSWREMYAYNTLVDMQIETKVLKGLWQKIKIKYWG